MIFPLYILPYPIRNLRNTFVLSLYESLLFGCEPYWNVFRQIYIKRQDGIHWGPNCSNDLVFGGKIFQETIRIPIWMTDLLLFSYEAEFIEVLVKSRHIDISLSFNFTFRYIDDVLSLNKKISTRTANQGQDKIF